MRCWWALAVVLSGCLQASTYEVGPGRQHESIGSVPWESLEAGDVVRIYWRPEPYREKWVLCRQGTAQAPIVVRGVASPSGQLPVIDGNGAVTRTVLNYWNEVRGLLKIGGANYPPDTMPRHIAIENLEFRSARPPFTFTTAGGAVRSYAANAAAIYVEKGEHIMIRNCVLRDSGNGLFVGSLADQPSRDFLVEGNHLYDNGNEGSAYEHNNYSAALGIVFQYNRFGPPKAGSVGNNLKDRSAGLVVRYNWIEGGNRQLDLVDAEDSSVIAADPAYRTTFVYGNVFLEPDGAGNRQMIHYGGDSGDTGIYRKGNLHLYNNTFVSTRGDRTTLLRLSTNDETADVRNNIVYVTQPGDTLSMLDESGMLFLSHNWFKPGRRATFGTLAGVISDDGTSIEGPSPGFADEAAGDYRPAAGSAAVDAGTWLHPAVLPDHAVVRQYRRHRSGEVRPADASLDVGAFERDAASRCDLNRDGAVNYVDLLVLISIAIEPAYGGWEAADLNRDGVLNAADLQTLADVLLNKMSCPE